uniref:Uncharacterized protein AlNc14C22G2249 n=1 Tax=Albugo laibachii Nc14 TaxID=890382 RepID=F0W5T4_9STRA|nr:conserved hypothetical protein [Albugo laibachii Nc14]|eukprot:CCA16475.1 conserved hypothetical protein [Albugo laibachii Nc14]
MPHRSAHVELSAHNGKSPPQEPLLSKITSIVRRYSHVYPTTSSNNNADECEGHLKGYNTENNEASTDKKMWMTGNRHQKVVRKLTDKALQWDNEESNRRISISCLDFYTLHSVFKPHDMELCPLESPEQSSDEEISSNESSVQDLLVDELSSYDVDLKRSQRFVSQTISLCNSNEEGEFESDSKRKESDNEELLIHDNNKDEKGDDLEVNDIDSFLWTEMQVTRAEITHHSSRRRYSSDPGEMTHLKSILDSNDRSRDQEINSEMMTTTRLPRPCNMLTPYSSLAGVQGALTTSVRRLVINLKDESDRHKRYTSRHPRYSALPSVRRRGKSCPTPYQAHSKRYISKRGCSSCSNQLITCKCPIPVAWIGSGNDACRERSMTIRGRKRSTLTRFASKMFRSKRTSYLFTDEELSETKEVRWKIVQLAFRFGGQHRFELVQALNEFSPLLKYGRRGEPHSTRLYCNQCGTLQWQQKRGRFSEPVDLADVLHIIDGRQTTVFRKHSATNESQGFSFSIIFKDRTLDLETTSTSERNWLLGALRVLILYAQKQRQAEHQAIAESAILALEEPDHFSPDIDSELSIEKA